MRYTNYVLSFRPSLVILSICFFVGTLCLSTVDFTVTYASQETLIDSEAPLVEESIEIETTAHLVPDFNDVESNNEEPAVAQTIPEEVSLIKSQATPASDSLIPTVPFYSQFTDISDPSWKKIGCGIASLAMLISYYGADVSVDDLLLKGIATNAYLNNAGWTYAGLIGLSKDYELDGYSTLLEHLSVDDAFASLQSELEDGPVMASVHYTFEPTNPIPHLVIVNGVQDGRIFYNDPAEPNGGNTLSVEKFKKAWKKRYITIRPNS